MKKLLILFTVVMLVACSKDDNPKGEQLPIISSISINDNGGVYNNKTTDEDKNLLPLHPIYFLGSNE